MLKFNWIHKLKELVINPDITDSEHEDLASLAEDWPTCACGELCKKLPKNLSGIPLDSTLWKLGSLFCSWIALKKWDKAIEVFYEIESRTSYLLSRN